MWRLKIKAFQGQRARSRGLQDKSPEASDRDNMKREVGVEKCEVDVVDRVLVIEQPEAELVNDISCASS